MDSGLGLGGWRLTCDHVMPVPVHLGIRLGEVRDVLIRALPLMKDALFVLDEVVGESCCQFGEYIVAAVCVWHGY